MVYKYIKRLTFRIFILEQRAEVLEVLGINLQVYKFNIKSTRDESWGDFCHLLRIKIKD